MAWNEVKTTDDIEKLQQLYNNFRDSTLVGYRFESGNFVDKNRVSHEYNDNNLYLLFQRLDDNPFSIEILFQYTTRFNFLAPIGGQSSQRTEINFAKIEKNSEYFYWTEWEGFDPYNEAHLKYNDFILIEAERGKWRIIE